MSIKSFELLVTEETTVRRAVERRLRGHAGGERHRRADSSLNLFDRDIWYDLHDVHSGCNVVASVLVVS